MHVFERFGAKTLGNQILHDFPHHRVHLFQELKTAYAAFKSQSPINALRG